MNFKKDLLYLKKNWICAININNIIYYNYILELCNIFIIEYPSYKELFINELYLFIFNLSKKRNETINQTAVYLVNNYSKYLYFIKNKKIIK